LRGSSSGLGFTYRNRRHVDLFRLRDQFPVALHVAPAQMDPHQTGDHHDGHKVARHERGLLGHLYKVRKTKLLLFNNYQKQYGGCDRIGERK